MERKISEKGTREIDIKKNAGEDETQLTFSLRLNALLKEKKMSQKDFADKTGLSVGAISNYCSGKRLPGGIEFVDILDTLEVSADYLLGRSDSATLNEDIQMMVKHTGLSEKSIETLNALKTSKNVNNFYMLSAVDFLLSNYDKFLEGGRFANNSENNSPLKHIADYLFEDYIPYYENDEIYRYTLEDLEDLEDLDDEESGLEGIRGVMRQLYPEKSNEEFFEFMNNNVWVNSATLTREKEIVRINIPSKDLKGAILVQLNQMLNDCYQYLHEDKEGQSILNPIIKEALDIYFKEGKYAKKDNIESEN